MKNEVIETALLPLEVLQNSILFKQIVQATAENRESNKRCLIPALNDVQAIECWLSEYQKSAATARNYRKEAERLLLWTLSERNKLLSSLTAEDLLLYSQFLDNPQPCEKWCGPKLARNGKRWTNGWRPFVGPLSQNAKVAALKNLASLFNYLTENQYLVHNPMKPVRRQLKHTYGLQEEKWRVNKRIIDLDEWGVILNVLEAMPENTAEAQWEKARLTFLIALGYFGALRNHELTNNNMGSFHKIRDWQTGKERWWLHIKGKGGKVREVPVNDDLLTALFNYRRCLNLPLEPQTTETGPLLQSLSAGKGLTTRRINQLIKALTVQAARQFEATHPEKAERLKKFSAHWLRHLSCSMQGLANIDKQNIKENAGHENASTTDIYLHASDILRHQQMNQLSWRPNVQYLHIIEEETHYNEL